MAEKIGRRCTPKKSGSSTGPKKTCGRARKSGVVSGSSHAAADSGFAVVEGNQRQKDPSSVYLDLISRQRGEGVIEMGHEADHVFASGYTGRRAVRTWQERMRSGG